MHRTLAIALLIAAGSCGGAATPSPTSAPMAGATTELAVAPTATSGGSAAAPTTSGGGSTWTVTTASKATVSVREQLVGISLPNDALLVAKGAGGAFTLDADGSFASDSKITFDLTTLTSDSSQRDSFVKQDTVATRQFPTATFVPTKATGLTLPLAADADVTFTLAGKMTIHGVTKDVTFDVVARRGGAQLTATATADPTWKFADFGLKAPNVPMRVVSIVDEIRLVVELVATAAAG